MDQIHKIFHYKYFYKKNNVELYLFFNKEINERKNPNYIFNHYTCHIKNYYIKKKDY